MKVTIAITIFLAALGASAAAVATTVAPGTVTTGATGGGVTNNSPTGVTNNGSDVSDTTQSPDMNNLTTALTVATTTGSGAGTITVSFGLISMAAIGAFYNL